MLWSARGQYFPNTWRTPGKFMSAVSVQPGGAWILQQALMFDRQSRGENSKRENKFALTAYNDETCEKWASQRRSDAKRGRGRSWLPSCEVIGRLCEKAKESEPSWWQPLHSLLPMISREQNAVVSHTHARVSPDAPKWLNECPYAQRRFGAEFSLTAALALYKSVPTWTHMIKCYHETSTFNTNVVVLSHGVGYILNLSTHCFLQLQVSWPQVETRDRL